MGKIERFLERVSLRRPARLIKGDNGEPYLERYYLFNIGKFVTAYLHKFVASDPDRGLHDHPWSWAYSFILVGGYKEYVLPFISDKPIRYRRWSIRRITGSHYHRVILEPGEYAWTLFIHGKRTKGWGFIDNLQYGAMLMAASANDAKYAYSSADWWKTAQLGKEIKNG